MKMQGKSPLMKQMLGDLNKDGKMSEYEKARQNAIEEAMEKTPANMKMESAVKMGMAIKPPKPPKKKSGKIIMKKPKYTLKRKTEKPVELEPKPIPTVAKKEDEKGGKGKKIEYSKSTREWDSPKDLQNATSMVMAKINKAMLPPSKAKELAAQAKKLLSTGAVGNLDKLMDRNKISGNFTSFKGFSITPKKK